MFQIKKVTVEGYRSIKSLKNFELRPLNVLIGANGAGKSNFLSLFGFLTSLAGDDFDIDVQKWGGPEALLHYGSKETQQIELSFAFTHTMGSFGEQYENRWEFTLEVTQDNRFICTNEILNIGGNILRKVPGVARREPTDVRSDDDVYTQAHAWLLDKLKVWRQYHFHDTSDTAKVKRTHAVNDTLRLKPDAANLAAYLRKLKTVRNSTDSYNRIVDTIRRVAPFFGDFVFREDDDEYMQLEWTERGRPDTPWKAHMLSDGTLRFMCLTTLLLQPDSLTPDVVIIDEPELGLHPFAVNLVADMVKRKAESKQLIVSTQSVELLNEFEPEDVIVVQRENDASAFRRLESDALKSWLTDEYALGDLWKSNVLGGRPS